MNVMQEPTTNNSYLLIEGRTHRFGFPIKYILNLITLGIYHIMSTKFKTIKIFIETRKSNIKNAEFVLATNTYGYKELCTIKKFFFPYVSDKLLNFIFKKEIKYFDSQCMRFFFDFRLGRFVLPVYDDKNLYCIDIEDVVNLKNINEKGSNQKNNIEEKHNQINTKENEMLDNNEINGRTSRASIKFNKNTIKPALGLKNRENVNYKIMNVYFELEIKKQFKHEKKYKMDAYYKKYFFTSVEQLENYIIYSENSTEQKEKSIFKIMLTSLFNPLLIYNLIGIVLWLLINYAYYAMIICFMTLYSFFNDIIIDYKKNKGIREIAKRRKKVLCFRNKKWVKIDTRFLFPGDIFYVEKGKDFPCDARILKGEVIVDESFLTGETVPVFKSDENTGIIYAGTEVLKSYGSFVNIEDTQSEEHKVKVKNISKREAKRRDKLKKINEEIKKKFEENNENDFEEFECDKNNYDTNSHLNDINFLCQNRTNIVDTNSYDQDNFSNKKEDKIKKHNFNQNKQDGINNSEDYDKTNTYNITVNDTVVNEYNEADEISATNDLLINNRLNINEVDSENLCSDQNVVHQNQTHEDDSSTNILKTSKIKESYHTKNVDYLNEDTKNWEEYNQINLSNSNLDLNVSDGKEIFEDVKQGNAIVIVLTTRFNTAKGKLIKNILIPKPLNFVFQKESMTFILVTFILSCIFVMTIFTYFVLKMVSKKDSLCYALDLLFCILSPALPATIWIGSSFSAKRLKNQKVSCNENNRINIAGKVDLVVFDKTGTLTEEGLDVNNIDTIDDEIYCISDLNILIREGLGSCHSIYKIENELLGDPLDIKMFLFSESVLRNEQGERLIIIGESETYEGPVLKEMKDDENTIYYYRNIIDAKNEILLDEETLKNNSNVINTINYNNKKDSLNENHYNSNNYGECNNDLNHIVNTKDKINKNHTVNKKDELYENHTKCKTKNNFNEVDNSLTDVDYDNTRNDYNNNEKKQNSLINKKISSIFKRKKKVVNIIKVLKVNDFNNRLRRMSVVTKDMENNKKVFVKGSPESILKLLIEVPEDYEEVVKDYALDGYRVITLAYRNIDDENYEDRNLIEKDLIFLCFIIFANKLKNETVDSLEELSKANIKTMMATGDNILTAISVAKQCKIIDKYVPVLFPVIEEDAKSIYDASWHCIGDDELHFDKIKLMLYKNEDRISYDEFYIACEGKEYEQIRKLNKEYFNFLLKKGVVFARMNFDQKKMLIEDLSEKGYTTCFCGDGANDCGALKSADIGIALADNEASIASCFTSTVKNISSVLVVLKEGRCALVTSFSNFQFIVLSSFIQCFSLSILSALFLFLNDLQTIHNDLLLILPLAYIMTEFKPSNKINDIQPESRLFKKENIFYVGGHFMIDASILVIAIILGEDKRELFDKRTFLKQSLKGTYTFFISSFQILFLGMIFTKGKPHRESKYKMKYYMIFITFVFIYNIFLLYNCYFNICNWLNRKYENERLKMNEYLLLIFLIVVNFCVSFIFEKFCDTNIARLFIKKSDTITNDDDE